MRKNNKKTSAGITLIALVVTIIVLLILAGISIQMLTGDNGILQRAGQAKVNTDIATVEELANLEVMSDLIGTKSGSGTERSLAEVLETLKTNGDIEAYAPTSSVTGFNFNGVTSVNVGTSEGLKSKVMQAEFTSPPGTGAYYVQIKGKKYPISKTNGKITIEKTEITGAGASAKLTGATSNDESVATVDVTDDNEITITGKATGETTITVKSTGLPDVNLTVNVKRETTITVSSDTTGCTVSPTSAIQIEGEKVRLTATSASGKVLKGWYVGSSTTPITDNPFDFEVPKDANYISTVTIQAKFEDKPSELTDTAQHTERYGKKVLYGVNLDNNTATADWKIFYEDKSYIYLIASDYVKVSILSDLYSDYDKTETTKKTIAEALNISTSGTYNIYWADADAFQKAGAEAIFGTTGVPAGTSNLVNKGFLKFWKNASGGSTSTNPNAKMTASLMDTKMWAGFASGYSGAFAIGGPTLSMFAESWNALHGTASSDTNKAQIYYNRASSKGYYVNTGSQPSTSNDSTNLSSSTGYSEGNGVTTNAYSDNLYFPHKGSSAFSNCYGYWLASPSAGGTFYVVLVSCNGYVGNDPFSGPNYGVRPIVCLPSSITLTEVKDNNNVLQYYTLP